jgi:hypothetical protein
MTAQPTEVPHVQKEEKNTDANNGGIKNWQHLKMDEKSETPEIFNPQLALTTLTHARGWTGGEVDEARNALMEM